MEILFTGIISTDIKYYAGQGTSMDRAAKVKKYRKKRKKMRSQRMQQPMGIFVLCLLGAGIFAALLITVVHNKKDASGLMYVTQEEFALLMSFLGEDSMLEAWENEPDAMVTQGKMKELIQNIGLSRMISVEGGSEKLSRKKAMEYYSQILEYLDLGENVRKETILVLSQSKDACRTADGELELTVKALKLEEFHVYDAYLLGETVLGICAQSDKTAVLKEVTIDSIGEGHVFFEYQGEGYQIACEDVDDLYEMAVCTLCIKDGRAVKVKDIEGTARAIEAEGDLAAKELPETVKVLLLNKGAVHYDQIYISCNGRCSVAKGKKKTDYKASSVINVKKLKIKIGKCASIAPEKWSSKLFLTDKDGKAVSKGYYGRMVVYRDSQGYYIVNKVNIEKYLYSVVASEMPSSFETEALKAQAVCARSYVYRQMQEEDYRAYHAQIDDSTNYQVYNKSDVSREGIAAVKETSGIVMYAGDEIVNAYYFSSSCGFSSGMEIWNQDGECEYLSAKSLMKDKDKGKDKEQFDLSDERAFRQFIASSDREAYDSTSRYYRWKAKVELSACIEKLREVIQSRYKINPDNFDFYSTAGKKPKKVSSLKGFGGVKKMYCSKRGKSGAILELTIRFEFGKVVVKSEYNIRAVVGCGLEKITYADGSTDTSSRFLPSAYFSISYDEKSKRCLLTGGGNGHGMGMSQYGADSMAKEGWDYQKILKFSYDGIELKKIN